MKTIAKIIFGSILLVAVVFGVWWVVSAPPAHLVIAPPYVIGEVPASIVAVTAQGDPIGEGMITVAEEIGGYDDVLLQEHLGRAFVTARDGWIWQIDLDTGEAERVVDVPLMAAGALMIPGDDNRLCFCASVLYGETYPEDERVGLYELNLETKEITMLVDRVPLPPTITAPRLGNEGTVFTAETETRLRQDEMTDANSRPLAFCNDVTVSKDGNRFYISEPFPYEGASMGGGAFGEAVTLGNNGRLWNFDRETGTVALVAQNYNFIDGVLLDETEEDLEQSILVTETTKFRILRFYLRGEKAGQDEIVWEFLPGLADALERDAKGNIWVGIIKTRSPLMTWMHANPWIKPLMLRIPQENLPVPTVTAIMALSPDASTPLFYAEHPGTHVHDIAAAIPGKDFIYLANFSDLTPGLHKIPNPLTQKN